MLFIRIGFVVLATLHTAACGGGSSGNSPSPELSSNSNPSITINGDVVIAENTTAVVQVSAIDDDSENLSFSLSGDDASLFSIDSDGNLIFAAAPDFEAPQDTDGNNDYALTVRVSDGQASDSLAMQISVTNDESDDFQLSAGGFSTGNAIPLIHACTEQGGNNYSPQLTWQNVPDNTERFALIIDDETAPCGTDANACVHWNLFNLDKSITGLVEDVSPSDLVDEDGYSAVIEGLTYASTNDYEGPCPPSGNSHTYFFTLYALSAEQPTMTRLDALTRSEFEEAYAGNILGQAQITGTYSN